MHTTIEPIPVNAVTAAFEYHSGGGSPLYQFASTRTVHSAEHRVSLFHEIKLCRLWEVGRNNDPAELSALDNLRDMVELATIGEPLMSFREYCNATE